MPRPYSKRAMQTASALALPRVGLLGNPSDLYGGRGMGFPVWNWRAKVTLTPGARADEEIPLLQAARAVFLGLHPEVEAFSLAFQSNIPSQAGLAGSSAIVMAALRAMLQGHDLKWSWRELADATLAAERDHLGILGGPMDRWIQAQEHFLWMDFATEETEPLSLQRLPSLRILLPAEPGQPSGSVHAPIMERWRNGDVAVQKVMGAYPSLVDEGRAALLAGDFVAFAKCMDRNFDLRASLFPIQEQDQSMIALCRRHGAAAKFCGSGGSVLAMHAAKEWQDLETEAKQAGIAVLELQLTSEAT